MSELPFMRFDGAALVVEDPQPHAICPHCGFSLLADRPITRVGWTLKLNDTHYHGTWVKLSPMKRELLYALARSYPRVLTADALMQRVGLDTDYNTLRVQISNLRRELREMDFPVPVRTVLGGYVWSDESVAHSAYTRLGGNHRKPGVVHGH